MTLFLSSQVIFGNFNIEIYYLRFVYITCQHGQPFKLNQKFLPKLDFMSTLSTGLSHCYIALHSEIDISMFSTNLSAQPNQ